MTIRLTTMVVTLAAGMAFAQPAARKSAPAKPASTTKTWKDLQFKPLPEIKLPDITEFTLSNGMRVFLLENHELPVVRGSASIRAGNVFDPPAETGLSEIFGGVMRNGGTKTVTGDELNEILEGMGASIEASVGETRGTVSFNTLAENTDTVLGLFKDILTAPEFRQDKLDILKNQYRGVISRRNDEPAGIASREFERLLYGRATPWGRQPEYETVERVDRADLVAMHRRYFYPANILLAVQGDFAIAEMRPKLEKLFADWTAKAEPAPPLPPVPEAPVPGIFVATKGDVTQTFFRIGHLGGMIKDKDYPALSVMADILGGGFNSRLFRKIRTELGLAYNVGASWDAEYSHRGRFFISGSTKTESTVQTLRATLGEIERIRSSEVTDDELKLSKDSALNAFVFNFDSPGKTLSRLVTYQYYGYPRDFIFQYQKAVAAVTKADVLRVAKEYLKPEHLTIVATGAPQIEKDLQALNQKVTRLDITIPEPKREQATADAQSLARGKEMLQKMQAAVGGADKLAAIKDWQTTAEVSMLAGPGGGMKIGQVARVVAPSTVRFDQKLPFGTVTIYSDGKGSGWMKAPQGEMPLPPQAAAQLRSELFRLPFVLWVSDRISGRTVNAVGPNVVEITEGDNWARLHIDPKTGLPEKLVYRSTETGSPTEAEGVYSDWKPVDGLQFPHKIKLSQGGKPAAEITVQEYKLNSGISPESLSQK